MLERADARVRVVAEGFSFLEGPRWRDGRLFVSDFYLKTVFAIGEDGERTALATVPRLPSGLGFNPSNELLCVSMLDRHLLRLSPDRDPEVVADLSALTPFPCNDLFVDGSGRAYVGNFGWDSRTTGEIRATRLIMVSSDGHPSIAAEGLVFPNGMARSGADGALLVAETFAARISAFDIAEDGSLRNRRTWADFTGTGRTFCTTAEALGAGVVLPDGLAADAAGRVWVANAAGSAVVLVAPGGEILDQIDVSPLTPFAVALGGADGRTLFICAAPGLGGDERERIRKLDAKLLACPIEAAAVAREG